jgi:isoleucyl-tRNA synthetase
LIYRAIESWFVKEDDLKAKTVPAAELIDFIPESVKHRFINGLRSAPDWNISRSRFRGAPLPIWECNSCEHREVYGTIAQIEAKSGQQVDDLHRPYIDKIIIPCSQCGQPMQRVPEVLDCRFESGSMPYGQEHYLGEESDFTNKADFIAEGLDQTRGWFRSLHVLGMAVSDQRVFDHCVVTGMVLAEDGKKMSKSKKNYPDPS